MHVFMLPVRAVCVCVCGAACMCADVHVCMRPLVADFNQGFQPCPNISSLLGPAV